MLGFLFGTVCLVALVKVMRRSRWGWGHRAAFASYGGGCGYGSHRGFGGHGHGGWGDDRDVGWRGGRGGGGFVLRSIFERLDTTPGQEKVIRGALDDLRAKARAVKDDARGGREELARALRGESIDVETLGTIASRASGAVDSLRDAAIGAVVEVHGALDARQRAILADLIERGPRFGGWRGRRGPYRDALDMEA